MSSASDTHILTVDVGNTTTRFGLFAVIEGADAPSTNAGRRPELLGSCEFITLQPLTCDEARVQIKQALALLPGEVVRGAILSCVIPSLTSTWRQALSSVSEKKPLVVGPGLKSGVRMNFDDPSEVGPDRVADVVAARASYPTPSIVVDLGTTTNFEAIDEKGAFAGGIIAPGVALGARSLTQAAARLPMIELRTPRHVIGRNTRAAMQSGVVLGEVARIDGLLNAMSAELNGTEPCVVITGDNACAIAAMLRHDAIVDDTLTMRGLALLWISNQPNR